MPAREFERFAALHAPDVGVRILAPGTAMPISEGRAPPSPS